jgi:hypothetical protein
MHTNWESELAELLRDLTVTQGDLLELLAEKGRRLVAADPEQLAAVRLREEDLQARLEGIHRRRGDLLARARQQGMPSDSLQSLGASLGSHHAPRDGRHHAERDDYTESLEGPLRQAAARSRILQHQSLANWVVTQRALLHLAQLLEIIGTGGRERPIYEKAEAAHAGGALVDQRA